MNKNKIAITLIIAALSAPMLTQAQGKGRKGAPNSVREQRGEGNSVNRQSVRQPLNSNNNQRGNRRGERKPQTGMTRTENGEHQHRRGVNIKEALSLSDKQAARLRAIHEKWHKAAKAIHSNKELSEGEKKAKLRKAFQKMDAAIRKLLNKEQYAKLIKLRRDRAKPRENREK